MSDLGSIATWMEGEGIGVLTGAPAGSLVVASQATYQQESYGNEGTYYYRGNLLAMRLGGIESVPDLLPYTDQYAGDGTPVAPCLRMQAGPTFFRFRWAVAAGSPTISISVKQADNLSPRPTLVIKANPSIGINADITLTASSSAGWVTMGPQTVNPTGPGGLWVEMHNNLPGWRPCLWDNPVTTT